MNSAYCRVVIARAQYRGRRVLATSVVALVATLSVPDLAPQRVGLNPLAASASDSPNFVLILADDLGYADVGCFGASGYQTPHLDRMASEGMRFTSFYVAQAVCSASRAALLTGCYPNRIGIRGALDHRANYGISAMESTIAKVLKPRGYATAIFGKWHLGHHPEFLPTRHGFDEYFGLPYSNDMWPNHPAPSTKYPDLPLLDGENVAAYNPDQSRLTGWYTERAVQFIERSRSQPFFLYLAHTMPHVPLHVRDEYRGRTVRGLYGDVVEEIDKSVGEILQTLRRLNLEEKTLVIFLSDNGPWLLYGNHAGSAGPFRAGKATAFDGGVRVPCIMRWPGKIPAGTACDEPLMTIDLMPTLARLAKAALPRDRAIDGRNIWPQMSGNFKAKSPHDALFFYWGDELHAIRSGRWKLHFPHPYTEILKPGADGKPGRSQRTEIGLSLFDMELDPGEATNVAEKHPREVRRLLSLGERARRDLGDALTSRKGKNVRPAGNRER